MRYKVILLLTFVLFSAFFGMTLLGAESAAPKGNPFPDITFSAPEKTSEKEYLGLSAKDSFKLSEIKADVVIVEIFSMYCPYCQKEAPIVNNLYNLIRSKPELSDRIKIVGIGANNSLYEVNYFKDQYKIQFPLFPDKSLIIHEKLEKLVNEKIRTPYFFVIKKNPDGSNKIIYSKVGSIQSPDQFLDMIIKGAGPKQEVSQ
jgi:thiol-disulfide isomerase/thioredoxin